MKNILTITFLLISFLLKAQDTITVLQYNLLNYGNYTSYCTSNNNNVNKKDGYIKTIINYVKPDIFSVNEMVAQEAMMEHLKGKINETWISKYKRPSFIYSSSDYIANTVYYNSEKLTFQAQYIAQTYVRDVNIFKFYYNSPALENGDTAFIFCVVAHLKAGSGTSNSNQRKIMINNTMNYIKNFDPENNYMLMGDFNMYTSQEPAWDLITNYSDERVRFNDPINKPGDWNNNYQFRYIHTQSTHENSSGCAAGGGMDDRFDFIFISNDIKNGNKKVKYVNGSYRAVGQDGNHFNKSINASPTNTSVPSNVLNALYKNSDHLPVMLKLAVMEPVGINENPETDVSAVNVVNPVGNRLYIRFNNKKYSVVKVSVFDITGRIVKNFNITAVKGENETSVDVSMLNPGFYFIKLTDKQNGFITKKLIKR